MPAGLDANSGSLLKVIGDHHLQQQASIDITLPPGLLGRSIHAAWTPAATTLTGHASRYGLRLPLEQTHTILLLAPETMLQHLPLEHVFPPILANLSRAIKLCNDSEQLAISLQAERNQVMVQLTGRSASTRPCSMPCRLPCSTRTPADAIWVATRPFPARWACSQSTSSARRRRSMAGRTGQHVYPE
jgi:hypothetical protein